MSLFKPYIKCAKVPPFSLFGTRILGHKRDRIFTIDKIELAREVDGSHEPLHFLIVDGLGIDLQLLTFSVINLLEGDVDLARLSNGLVGCS